MLLKFCQRCLRTKTTDQFYANRAHTDQLYTYCKTCDRAMCAARRAAHAQHKPISASTVFQKCRGCSQILAVTEFAIDRGRPLGRTRLCRTCSSLGHQARVARYALLQESASVPQVNMEPVRPPF